MAINDKKELEQLEAVLGVSLKGDADISIDLGEGKSRELRIRSLGSAAYDIWSAEVASETVQPKPREDLKPLEMLAGVQLPEGATIDVSVGEKTAPLRIRSLGAKAYDIWSASQVKPQEG